MNLLCNDTIGIFYLVIGIVYAYATQPSYHNSHSYYNFTIEENFVLNFVVIKISPKATKAFPRLGNVAQYINYTWFVQL